jgi:hypothetical protein
MFGQSSGNNNSQKESVSVDKESSKKRVFFSSIKDNLNAKVVVAYGNKSSEVITDFYNYLTFYNQSETADLQKELDKSIQQMFVSETTLIEDFINGTNKKITLLQFLQYCKENKFVVSVSNLQNTAVESNHFVMKYQLLVTNKSVTKTYNLSQKVYLYPVVKTFGNTEKVVWEIKLGEF